MWDNSVERRLIRNIIFAVLGFASLFALFYVMRLANTRRAEESASLVEVSSQKKAEQEQKITDNYLSLEDEYWKDMETMAEYLPGIVCWGDTLTRGTSGNVSYPEVLQSCIDDNLCEYYDFTSSLNGSVVYSGVDAKRYTVQVPVINMGGGDENTATILIRAGKGSMILDSTLAIPAEQEPVKIYFKSASGYAVNPMTIGDQGLNPVLVDGIEGTISYVANERGSYYTFTRSQPGEPYTAPRGAEISCSNSDIYADYIHVIWLGAYDKTLSAEQYMEWCEELLSRQTKNTDRYILIGPCTFHGSWNGGYAQRLDAIDEAMLARYGEHYINVRKYLLTDGLRDANITASGEAKTIALGEVPKSFRSANESVELSATAYELVGKLVYDRMFRLGYFSEMIEELEIELPKTVKE